MKKFIFTIVTVLTIVFNADARITPIDGNTFQFNFSDVHNGIVAGYRISGLDTQALCLYNQILHKSNDPRKLENAQNLRFKAHINSDGTIYVTL